MNNAFIGALSGTSMDAIDVALVDFKEQKPKLLATLQHCDKQWTQPLKTPIDWHRLSTTSNNV